MEQLFSSDFWYNAYSKLGEWLINKGPALAFVIFLWVMSLWLYAKLISRIKKGMLKAARYSIKEESLEEKEKRVNTLTNIIREAGKIAIWGVYILIFFRQVDLDIGPILASAGIIGLAIGFGAQELVRDFISGFFMIMENQVRAGDVAIINGTGGLVEEIALRTITLRDFSGTVHIFQNGKINTLSNMTKEWSAMVFDIGVAYKEDIDRVVDVIKQTGLDLKNDPAFKELIIEPIEVFGIDKFGDSAVIIKARIKTKPSQQWAVGREFNRRLKKTFDAAKIEIPFPHRTIYWGDAISPLKLSKDEGEKR